MLPKYTATDPAMEGEDSQSPMPDFTSAITGRQLIDIVAFLHSRYRKTGPKSPDYPLMA